MQTSFTLAQLADPDVAESEKILRACVHCGFCTATCPTYVLDGNELDSPRGRIYLIKDMLENDRPATADVALHIDRCLSCLACMTTCPSGVHYMHLVDHARAHIEADLPAARARAPAACRPRAASALSTAIPAGPRRSACRQAVRALAEAIGLKRLPPCCGWRRRRPHRPLAPADLQCRGTEEGPGGSARRLCQRRVGAANQRRGDSRSDAARHRSCDRRRLGLLRLAGPPHGPGRGGARPSAGQHRRLDCARGTSTPSWSPPPAAAPR